MGDSGIKGLGAFKRSVKTMLTAVTKGYPRLVRALAHQANMRLINSTRYLSGTARNSWEATVGSPTTAEPVILPPPFKGFKPPIARITRLAIAGNKKVILKWDLSKALFIASNLDYIVYLEEGTHNIKVADKMLANTFIAMDRKIQESFSELEREIVSKWG